MKKLKQITVIGTGLLGGSLCRAILQCFPKTKVVGYSHRASTRQKARQLAIASEIADDLGSSVAQAGMVILATPMSTFHEIFSQIASDLPAGCIVTDVGSTKVLPLGWAAKQLPRSVHYVGSHPIAGSEQRGVDFARDDLFDNTNCIVTSSKSTNTDAMRVVRNFWLKLGCKVIDMSPSQHDRIFAMVSHLPHVAAAALVNANRQNDLDFAGPGF
ncbi:MAG: prephenate dehydrogenase, partial [Planctomycetota bacterium]